MFTFGQADQTNMENGKCNNDLGIDTGYWIFKDNLVWTQTFHKCRPSSVEVTWDFRKMKSGTDGVHKHAQSISHLCLVRIPHMISFPMCSC